MFSQILKLVPRIVFEHMVKQTGKGFPTGASSSLSRIGIKEPGMIGILEPVSEG